MTNPDRTAHLREYRTSLSQIIAALEVGLRSAEILGLTQVAPSVLRAVKELEGALIRVEIELRTGGSHD